MSQTAYRAVAERDGKFWVVHVPEIDRWTQARSVAEVEVMARDLIAIMLDVDPATVEVEVEVHLPEEVAKHLSKAAHLRKVAAESNGQAALESRRAAKVLRDSGMTVRDVGKVLGVSHQRAQQLTR